MQKKIIEIGQFNPEDNFFKMPNGFWNAYCSIRIPGESGQIFRIIIRETYGYRRLWVPISIEKFVQLTGMAARSVRRAEDILLDMNMITVREKAQGKTTCYCIQSDYTKWKHRKKQTVREKAQSGCAKKRKVLCAKKRKVVASKTSSSKGFRKPKDSIKDNIKDNSFVDKKLSTAKGNIFDTSDIRYKLSDYLFQKILSINPEHKKPNMQTWARHIDYLLRLDKRNPDSVRNLIDWLFDSNDENAIFWRTNILSTKALRDKYDCLILKMVNSLNKYRDKNAQSGCTRLNNDVGAPKEKDITKPPVKIPFQFEHWINTYIRPKNKKYQTNSIFEKLSNETQQNLLTKGVPSYEDKPLKMEILKVMRALRSNCSSGY